MNILITGSSGHLGEALMRMLPAHGHQVRGIDLVAGPYTHAVGTITDHDFVGRHMVGIDAVLHTATLHKPHVATHGKQAFVDTNITGTLRLLEAAAMAGVQAFVFTSTTSTFGDALTPAPGQPAVWITEAVTPMPKNIYGATKTAAEDLCQLFARNHQLPCMVLRTSRFFPEADDNADIRRGYTSHNAKANELLYRRVDVADVCSAHLLALEKAPDIGFDRYIISATTPFEPEHLPQLNTDAPALVRRLYPTFEALYARQQWRMFPTIGRVYVNQKARRALGWQPKYDFNHVLQALTNGTDYRSPLTLKLPGSSIEL